MLHKPAQADKRQVRFYDSLPATPDTAKYKAQLVLEAVAERLDPLQLEASVLPGSTPTRKQADGTSCGWFSLMFAEQVRHFRGVAPRIVETSPAERRQQLNKLVQCLLHFKAAQHAKAAKGKAPPPLPPPVDPPPLADASSNSVSATPAGPLRLLSQQ